MSANNYILIKKVKDKFKVQHLDADTEEVSLLDKTVNTLDEAVKEAQKFTEDMEEDGLYIEYGTQFDLGDYSN